MSKTRSELTEKKFDRLSTGQRIATVTLTVAQIGLAAYAAFDLVRRPESQIRGSKAGWAPALLVNWVGPASYLAFGRIKPKKVVEAKADKAGRGDKASRADKVAKAS